jgi:hypothetical protein
MPSMTEEPQGLSHDYPSAEDARRIREEQDFHRAVEAYRFFYPTVSAEGLFNGTRELGIRDGTALVILAAGPRHVAFTADPDTPCATGVLDLREMGPVVIDLPPGPFIGLVDDHHQRWITDMGIPGADGGQGGLYLVVPPDVGGRFPDGFHCRRSPTFKAVLAVRALPTDGGTAGALDALRQMKVYPLEHPSAVLPFIDVSDFPFDASPLRWEDNLGYWERLHAVVQEEPSQEEFRPMYGELAALGIQRGQPFDPDPHTAELLERAARAALEEMRVEGFASQRPDRLVWADRRWEWVGLVPQDADFETDDFIDLEARDRWFFQSSVASRARLPRQPGGGSLCFLAARDETGAFLDGGRRYRLTIPQPIPARLLWSITAYDAHTRSQVQTPQDRAALSSLQQRFTPDPDGSLTLHFGPDAPAAADHWIRTPPRRGFFLYLRLHAPTPEARNDTWRPGNLIPL